MCIVAVLADVHLDGRKILFRKAFRKFACFEYFTALSEITFSPSLTAAFIKYTLEAIVSAPFVSLITAQRQMYDVVD